MYYYNSLDLQFSKAMMRIAKPNENNAIGATLCRLLSYQIRKGHVCLDRNKAPALEIWPRESSELSEKSNQQFEAQTQNQEQTQAKEQLNTRKEREQVLSKKCLDWLSSSSIVSSNPKDKILPLVWKNPRLYLYRYYAYEEELKKKLLGIPQQQKEIDQAYLLNNSNEASLFANIKKNLAKIYSDFKIPKTDLASQSLAVILSCLRPFLIISGGPGTGKTSTISLIIALNRALWPKSKIALTAPTGKATMRMKQAMLANKTSEEIPEVFTLQRLLKQSRDGMTFYHNKNKPLDLDLLVIDEASMINLSLLAHTLRALKPTTRLILIGDHHQLASVESGAVLGDLCRFPESFDYDLAQKLERLLGHSLPALVTKQKNLLTNSIIVLKKNFRFKEDSGIALLSQAIHQGDKTAAISCLQNKNWTDINYFDDGISSAHFKENIITGLRPCFAEQEPQKILEKIKNFCVLSPFRGGRDGTKALNTVISNILLEQEIISMNKNKLNIYPILIHENDYQLKLFNGDLGIVCQENEKTVAYFHDYDKMEGEEGLRTFPLALLPAYEMAFSMTVHRSQGSEFENIILILPKHQHHLITRELIYTALTRARKKIILFASVESIEFAITNPTERSSGLLELS